MDAAGLSPGPLPPAMAANEYMSRVAELPLAHQPGTRWSYHVGSEILSVLLARAGRASLQQLLQERITGPLGMESTGFTADPDRLPTAYQPRAGELGVFDEPAGMFSQPPLFESLAAGLVSTVPDYLNFLAALADDTLLPAGLRAQMTSDQLTPGQKVGLAGMVGPGESWQLAAVGGRPGRWKPGTARQRPQNRGMLPAATAGPADSGPPPMRTPPGTSLASCSPSG